MKRPDIVDLLTWACWGAVALILLVSMARGAAAADGLTCARYGVKVEQLVMALTNDVDVAQAARYRAVVYCGVIDEPPRLLLDGDQGTAPATTTVSKTPGPKRVFESEPAPSAVAVSKPKPAKLADWQITCKKRYRSLNTSDWTVIPAGTKKRVPCPVPH